MNADQPRTARSYGYDSSYSSFQSSDLRIFGYDVCANSFGTIKLGAFSGNAAGFGRSTGKERDSESGLDYFGARYYGSALGRFTSPDWSASPEPIPYANLADPQTLNLYSYVRNNPLAHPDVDGHCPVCIVLEEVAETPEGQELEAEGEALVENAAPYVESAANSLGNGVKAGIAAITAWFTTQKSDTPKTGQPTTQPNRTPPATGPVDPKPPTVDNAEHTKGARKSTKDKHEATRSGDNKPPNYVPDRQYVQPKPKKSNVPPPPKVRRNKYKKEIRIPMPLPSEIFDSKGRLRNSPRIFVNLMKHADAGDPYAQSLVGYCYLSGKGTSKDSDMARRWLLKAAQKGESEAMCNLALMYEVGDGVPQNLNEARKWYERAARLGAPMAQMNLGLMFLNSRKTKRNEQLGIYWLRQAAKRGNARAAYNLGEAHVHGNGVRKSSKIAKKYFLKAAEMGDPLAKARLRDLAYSG